MNELLCLTPTIKGELSLDMPLVRIPSFQDDVLPSLSSVADRRAPSLGQLYKLIRPEIPPKFIEFRCQRDWKILRQLETAIRPQDHIKDHVSSREELAKFWKWKIRLILQITEIPLGESATRKSHAVSWTQGGDPQLERFREASWHLLAIRVCAPEQMPG